MIRPRPLTYDERKAAEAAFRGLPLDPNWTEGARSVYLGMDSAVRLCTATNIIPTAELENSLDLQTASV